nr:hypothetical protein [Klebsiella pneumoniae]
MKTCIPYIIKSCKEKKKEGGNMINKLHNPGHGLGYKEILDQQGNFLLTVEMRDQLQNVLDANMMLADKLNYSGTPVFIVMNMKNPQNKTTTIMPGAPDFYRLQQAINKAKGN